MKMNAKAVTPESVLVLEGSGVLMTPTHVETRLQQAQIMETNILINAVGYILVQREVNLEETRQARNSVFSKDEKPLNFVSSLKGLTRTCGSR